MGFEIDGGGGWSRGGNGSINPIDNTKKNYNKIYPDATTAPVASATKGYGGIGASDYLANMQTAFTPEQLLQMRNRAQTTAQSQNEGATEQMRNAFARQGLGGSGAEMAAMGNILRSQAGNLQGVLSNLDIANAQEGLSNQFKKAGLMSQYEGQQGQLDLSRQQLDEEKRRADIGAGQWGSEYNYRKAQDIESQKNYDQQFAQLQKLLSQFYNFSGGNKGGMALPGR